LIGLCYNKVQFFENWGCVPDADSAIQWGEVKVGWNLKWWKMV